MYSECITLIHNQFSANDFLDMRIWLINNVGSETEIGYYIRDRQSESKGSWVLAAKGNWALASYLDRTLCWIKDKEKRTEFMLTWC